MFELYYLPLHLELGDERSELPGMLVKLPPRRVQRSRSQDVLIALLTLFGGGHPGARVLDGMLEEAANLYYTSRSSTTSGLRAAAEHLNHLFLKYNARLQGNRLEGQIFAYLNLAVLRNEDLFLLHVGATSSFLLQPDNLKPFQSESARGRGLGVSRTAPISYYQAAVKPDSLLLLCANPPATWADGTLARGPRLTINLLRRRLAHASGGELQAGIVQFRTSDQLAAHRLRPRIPLSQAVDFGIESETPAVTPIDRKEEEEVTPDHPSEDLSIPEVMPNESEAFRHEQESVGEVSPLAQEMDPDAEPGEAVKEVSLEDILPLVQEEPQKPAAHYQKPSGVSESRPPVRRKREPRQPDPMAALKRAVRRQARRKKLAAFWQGWNERQERFGQGIRSAFVRLLPGISEESPQLSAGSMVFISIIIPLLVVVIAVTIYLRNGRDQQHQLYLEQAQVFAADARQGSEPAAKRSNWLQALHWLDLAEEYRESEDSLLLRKQAGAALDELDGVERLDFKPLVSFGFSNTLNFVQIVTTDTEVYLLDSSQGRVLRLFLTGQGYELDNTFSCGPGASGTRLIADLVDLIALPPGTPNNATVMAVDGNGKLLYCIPGAEAPISGELFTPLEGWGEIAAIAYYQGSLYVLDSLYGAVYTYRGYNMEFGDEPELFFDPQRDESIPDLYKMIDLAAYGEDLYLLNENGTIAQCTSGVFEGNQTRCKDPASFGDMRPGMDADTLVFPNAFFAQIQTSLPPDPSLFLLDINAPAVYRFSLQLNLDRLLQPSEYTEYLLPQPPATAFSISPSRVVFIAYGNSVIYASLTF